MRISACFIVIVAVLSAGKIALAQAPAQPADQAVSKMAEFNTLFKERTRLIDSLKKLDAEYPSATEERKTVIMNQANQLFGNLIPINKKLVKVAEEVYTTSEKPNAQAELVLVSYCQGCFEVEDYEETLRLAKMLINHGAKRKELYLWGGIAAFCAGDPELAEKYLNTAKQQGVELSSGKGNPLDPTFLNFLQHPEKFKADWKKEQEIRAAEAKANDLPRVLFKTNKGDIEIELFENEAPNTTANIISLVESGYYDGLPFHRVLPGFMAQGGDNGRGGPGYTIPCECHKPNYRKHFRGSLSMAHTGQPNTGSAQFFLTFIPTTHLDGVHTVFGRVVKGMDVLSKIQLRDPTAPNAWMIKPDKIVKAKVLRKRPHEYVVKKVGDK